MFDYEDIYLEGYYDALLEETNSDKVENYWRNQKLKGTSKEDAKNFVNKATNNAVEHSATAIGLAGTAYGIHKSRKYNSRINELESKKSKEGLTPEEISELKKSKIKKRIAHLGTAAGVGTMLGGISAGQQNYRSRKATHKIIDKVYKESFMEGYYDALLEMESY